MTTASEPEDYGIFRLRWARSPPNLPFSHSGVAGARRFFLFRVPTASMPEILRRVTSGRRSRRTIGEISSSTTVIHRALRIFRPRPPSEAEKPDITGPRRGRRPGDREKRLPTAVGSRHLVRRALPTAVGRPIAVHSCPPAMRLDYLLAHTPRGASFPGLAIVRRDARWERRHPAGSERVSVLISDCGSHRCYAASPVSAMPPLRNPNGVR